LFDKLLNSLSNSSLQISLSWS